MTHPTTPKHPEEKGGVEEVLQPLERELRSLRREMKSRLFLFHTQSKRESFAKLRSLLAQGAELTGKTQHAWWERSLGFLASLCQHDDAIVREEAYKSLYLLPSDMVMAELRERGLVSPIQKLRGPTRYRLTWPASKDDEVWVPSAMSTDQEPAVRLAAFQFALRWHENQTLSLMRWRTSDHSNKHIQVDGRFVMMEVVECLRQYGDSTDRNWLVFYLSNFGERWSSDPKAEEREFFRVTLSALLRVAPQDALKRLSALSGAGARTYIPDAIDILEGHPSTKALIGTLLDNIRWAQDTNICLLLIRRVQKLAPNRTKEAWERAVYNDHTSMRRAMIPQMAEELGLEHLPLFEQLCKDPEEEVARQAMQSLLQLEPARGTEQALQLLQAESWESRVAAVQTLGQAEEPTWLDELIQMARDEDYDVRSAALRAIAKYDDVRVFSELASSLNDVSDNVRSTAKELLEDRDAVPVLKHFEEADGDNSSPYWMRLQDKVARIKRWANSIGFLLLGRPVIMYQYRQGLGRTWNRSRRFAVEIEVSDTPVTSGHPHGEHVMRGLVLHELGHHVCDYQARGFRTTRGIAKSEGIKDIYDILIDERLERVLRTFNPFWGVYFDRLASYAFAQTAHKVPLASYAELLGRTPEQTLADVQAGTLPGTILSSESTEDIRIGLRDWDILAVPDMLPPLTAWLWCLRCGFDVRVHPNPKVIEAVEAVPKHLRRMNHGEILELTRKIATLLGVDAENQKKLQKCMKKLGRQPFGLGVRRALQRMGEVERSPGAPRGADKIRQEPKVNIVYEVPPISFERGFGGRTLNLGADLDFEPLKEVETLKADPSSHAIVAGKIRPHVRQLRSYFERLGRSTVDSYAMRRGRRLDMAQVRQLAWAGRPNVLVHSEEQITPDLYLGILIDSSGSMHGDKLNRAKSFAVLVAESARGIRGIEGHILGFTDSMLFDLGDFQRNAITSLSSGGGNNDAGALQYAANLAIHSRKQHRILVMISDGSPTGCSVESLSKLVRDLTVERNFICAQVAVDALDEIAFPHYVDLSQLGFHEAVARFGRLLLRLVSLPRRRRAQTHSH